AGQFRDALTAMTEQLESLTRTLADQVIEHNGSITTVMRSESEEFTASAERAAQLFGRRIAELTREIDGAQTSVKERTEGLQELRHGQGERLLAAANDAGQRFRSETDLHEKRLVSINEAATAQARSLAEAVEGLAGRLTAAADEVGERFGRRLSAE